jgi:hypothetical protein
MWLLIFDLIRQKGHIKVHDIIWIWEFHLTPRILLEPALQIFLNSSLCSRNDLPATGRYRSTTIRCCCFLFLLFLILQVSILNNQKKCEIIFFLFQFEKVQHPPDMFKAPEWLLNFQISDNESRES